MIKQDYIIRMIQEIISSIAAALLKKKETSIDKMNEYNNITKQLTGMDFTELLDIDTNYIKDKYSATDDDFSKLELMAVSMILISDNTENDLLLKARLRQNGKDLLEYVHHNSKDFSIQREAIIKMLRME